MAEIKEKLSINKEIMGAIFVIIFASFFILTNLNLGFIWPLYVLFALISFIISLIYPRSGIFSLIFLTFIFERFFTLQSFIFGKSEFKIYPIDFIIMGVILSSFLHLISGKIKTKFNKADFFLTIFIILNAIFFILSTFFFENDLNLSFSTFKNYAFYGLIYFASLIFFRSERDIKNLAKFFLAGGISIIIFIIIGVIRGEGLWTEFTPLSTSGVRILAFTHGFYLSLILIPLMIFISFGQKMSGFWKMLILIWIVGIFGTMMRHLWVSLFLSFVLIFYFMKKEQRTLIKKLIFNLLLPSVAVLSVIFYFSLITPTSKFNEKIESASRPLLERAKSLEKTNEDESFSWRTLVWKSVWENYKNNLFFGIGTGQKIYVEKENYKEFIEARNIHNSYLSIILQFGILGFSFFLAFVYSNVKNLIQSIKKNQFLMEYKFSLLSAAILYCLVFMFQPYLETNMLGIFFWVILGLTRTIPEIKLEEKL